MDDFISREATIKRIEGQCVDGKMWGNDESEGTLIDAYSAIDDLIEIPAADVAPVRHGRWLHRKNGIAYCSECEIEAVEDGTEYCPNCGAKMDGGDGNER